jgi:tetratricopeptide (TPR) repeat protein
MPLFGKPKIEGYIGYFRLEQWWLSVFDDKEREYIERTFQPLSTAPHNRPLTKGTIDKTTQSAGALLGALAGWFKKPEDIHIADRIADKALELVRSQNDVLDHHFVLLAAIQVYYKERDVLPGALDKAIAACEEQISIAPKAAQAFKKNRFLQGRLPTHTGYEQLAIIRDKQGGFAEAVRLCEQAQKQGWDGDWDKRIARYGKKIAKQSS